MRFDADLYANPFIWYTFPTMILDIIQVVLAILLTVAILLQARGTNVGLAFGGDGSFYRTRRGIEKKLHIATVVIAVLFFGTALANSLFTF